MSIPGTENAPKQKKRGARRGESKGAGVESRAGGDFEMPELRSSNEGVNVQINPVVNTTNPVPAINTAEQTDAIRNAYVAQVKKEQEAEAAEEKARRAQAPASNLKPSSITTKQKITPQVELEQEDTTPFDVEKEREKMSSMKWLQDMRDQASAIDNEYKAKAERASKHAKMQAWGNMFSALGQLAGMGKNTFVAPDATYLKSAMTKADKAREMYEAIKTSNQKAIDKAKSDYLTAQEKTYYARQDAANKAIQARNKAKTELAKGNSSEIVSTVDNSEALTKMKLQSHKDLKAIERGDDLVKNRQKRESNAFINYKDFARKQNYNLNESEAMRIANLMIKSGQYTKEKLGLLQSFITGQVEGQDKRALVADILDYIEQYKNTGAVAAILNNSDNYSYGENSSDNNGDDLD